MNSNLEAFKNIRNNAAEEADKRREEARLKKADEKQAAIVEHQNSLLAANIWRSCLNCTNFHIGKPAPASGATECVKYRMLPPPNIIVHGCRDWEDDIPF